MSQSFVGIDPGYRSAPVGDMMRDIYGLFDRYAAGDFSRVEGVRPSVVRIEREAPPPVWVSVGGYAHLYELVRAGEFRTLCSAAKVAGLSTPGFYRWAKSKGLPTRAEDIERSGGLHVIDVGGRG